jgi:hypothetical protein
MWTRSGHSKLCPYAACGEVATDSAVLSVGFSVHDEPMVNQRQIDRGYHYICESELYVSAMAFQLPSACLV